MFVRLSHTDQPTTSPHSDDFDGDGISNWDEIRPGGTGTDPLLWDTDGDGKSDYFADTDGNGVADGWETTHFGGVGTVDPAADPDGDGQTNAQESWLGTSPFAHAGTNDQDKDGLVDAVDAVPDDALINWPKTPLPRYAFVDIGKPPGVEYALPLAVSEAGHVLFRVRPEGSGWLGYNYDYYVWQPDTGAWSGPLPGTGSSGTGLGYISATDVGEDGRIVGQALVEEPAQDSSAAARYYTTVEWADASAQPQLASGDSLSDWLGEPVGYRYAVPPAFSPDGALLSMDRSGYGQAVPPQWEWVYHGPTPVRLGGNVLDVCFVRGPGIPGVISITNYFGRPGKGNLVTMTRVGSYVTTATFVPKATGVYLFQNGVRETVDSTERRRAAAVARMPDADGRPGEGRLLVTGTHTWVKQGGNWHQTRRRISGWAVTPRGIILTGRKGWSDSKPWLNGRYYTVEELCPQLAGDGYKFTAIHDINDSGVMLCSSTKPGGGRTTVLLVPVDIDIIKPGTENATAPTEIDEAKEDTEGEAIEVNWDDDDKDAGDSGHGKVNLKADLDDANGVTGEDDLIQLKLHKVKINNTSFRLKYSEKFLALYKDKEKKEKITPEVTQFKANRDIIVYAEGRKISESEEGQKVVLQIKIGDGAWLQGDEITLHVARSVVGVFAEGGAGEFDLRQFAEGQKKDARTDPYFIKGKAQNGEVAYYAVRILSSEKDLKMIMKTKGSDIVYDGHSNFGMGPAFSGNLPKITGFVNLSSRGMASIDLSYFRDHQGHPNLQLGDADIAASPKNYNVPFVKNMNNKLRFPDSGKQNGETFQLTGNGDGRHHYTRPSGAKRVIVNSTGDRPDLEYRSLFMNSCNSGRDFIESLNHGVFFYTVDSCGGIETTKEYVKAVTEGKSWVEVEAAINAIENLNEHNIFP